MAQQEALGYSRGELLAAVGIGMQKLILLEITSEDQLDEKKPMPVQFIPMAGDSIARPAV